MAEHHQEIDWVAAERSPEFQELVKKKRAFVIPATIFFLAWYFGFIVLAGYAPDFMGREFLTDGLTVGYAPVWGSRGVAPSGYPRSAVDNRAAGPPVR